MTELTGMSGALFITITAFTVVFIVLGAMALFMHGLGWSVSTAVRIRGKMGESKNTGVPAASETSAAASAGIDDETVAAVTAAVSMMMGGTRFRVADIRPSEDDNPAWVAAARTGISDNRWSRR